MLGVFVVVRRGGGVDLSLLAPVSLCNAAIFAVVGLLRGSKFKGGNLRGWRFFFFDGVPFDFCSTSDATTLLFLDSTSILIGSCVAVSPDNSVVEMLLMLLASKGRLVFRLLKNGASAGDSLGDSYALGMAGTGGTSSSSLPAELWTFLVLGVGNLDNAALCGTRGCKDPVDVRAVL